MVSVGLSGCIKKTGQAIGGDHIPGEDDHIGEDAQLPECDNSAEGCQHCQNQDDCVGAGCTWQTLYLADGSEESSCIHAASYAPPGGGDEPPP